MMLNINLKQLMNIGVFRYRGLDYEGKPSEEFNWIAVVLYSVAFTATVFMLVTRHLEMWSLEYFPRTRWIMWWAWAPPFFGCVLNMAIEFYLQVFGIVARKEEYECRTARVRDVPRKEAG